MLQSRDLIAEAVMGPGAEVVPVGIPVGGILQGIDCLLVLAEADVLGRGLLVLVGVLGLLLVAAIAAPAAVAAEGAIITTVASLTALAAVAAAVALGWGFLICS